MLRKHKTRPYSEIRVHGLHPGVEVWLIEFCEFICAKISEDPRRR